MDMASEEAMEMEEGSMMAQQDLGGIMPGMTQQPPMMGGMNPMEGM
jgi:hypothetical protein